MKRKLFVYDSFTDKIFKGNQAGVLLFADDMSEESMIKISKELGYSETAFVSNSLKGDFKVRFFTPSEEVDLCGHATIAYVTALVDEGHFKIEEGDNCLNVETNIGIFPIFVEGDEFGKIKNIMMLQDKAKFRTIDKLVTKEDLMKPLGLSEESLSETIPVIAAYTGLWDILVPVKSVEELSNIKIDKDYMIEINKRTDTISYHVYVVEPTNTSPRIHARNFAPIVEIDEEGATGTSNAAMGAFLVKLGILDEGINYEIQQGKDMGRVSKITINIKEVQEQLIPLVGGVAIKVFGGEINSEII